MAVPEGADPCPEVCIYCGAVRRRIVDTYFKDYGDGHGPYMSGVGIPTDEDGVCRHVDFVNCDFHCGCSVRYEDCTFVQCDGTPNCWNECQAKA